MKMLAVSVVAMMAMAMVVTVTMAASPAEATATATEHPQEVTKLTRKMRKAADSDAFPPIARRDMEDDGTCTNTNGPTPINQYAILTVLARPNTLVDNAEDARTLLETNFVDAYNAVASCAQNGAFYTLTAMSIVRSSIGSTFIVTDPSANGGRRLEDVEEAEEIDFLILIEGECVGCPDIGGGSGPVFIDQIDPSILDQTQRRMMQLWQHQEGSSGKPATHTGATAKPSVKANHQTQTQTHANTDAHANTDVGTHQPRRDSTAKNTKQRGVERFAMYGLSDNLRDDNDDEDAIEPSAPSSPPRGKRGRLKPRRFLDGSEEHIHNGVSFSLLHRRSLNTAMAKKDDDKDKGRSGNDNKKTKANGTGASGEGDRDGETPDGPAPKSMQGGKGTKASMFSEPTSAPTDSTDPNGPAPGPDTTAAPSGKGSKMGAPPSAPSGSQKQPKTGSPMPGGTSNSTKMSKSENGPKECICFPPTISAFVNEYDAVIQATNSPTGGRRLQTATTTGIDLILSLVLVDPSSACTADDFETRTAIVLITIQIDTSLSSTAGGGLTDGQVEQFEEDLKNEYNAQNSGALNDQSCDPFFRRVINVELVQVFEGYSRRLQDSNTEPSFHGHRNMQTSTDFSSSIGISTYISIYTFFCFSCESGTLLYDDVDFVTVRRRRALNEEVDTYDDSADNSNIEGKYGYSSWTAEEFTPSQHHEEDPRFADILKAINAHKAKESAYANAGENAGTRTGFQPEDSPFGPPLNINNHRQLQSAIAHHRSLQGDPDDTINPDIDCLCSANATQEGVTEQQILNALNETLQINNTDPILFITNVQEVQEIDCSDTVDDEQVFDIRIAIELLVCEDDQQVSPLSLDDPRVPELEATFATTYNDLVAERYCDPFFRVINNVTFTGIVTDGSTVVPEEISGSIAVSIEAIVTLRCRGCDPAVTTLYTEGPLLATMSGGRRSRKMQYTDHASNRGVHDGGAHDGGDYDGTSDIGHDMGDVINEQLNDHLRSSINAHGDVDGDVNGDVNGSDSDSHTRGDSDSDDSTNVLKRTAADARLHINDNRACTSNSVTHPYDTTTTSVSSAGRALGAHSATRGGGSGDSRKPRRTNELTETCYCDIAPIAERSPSEPELMAVYNINVQDLGLACIVGVNECPPREPFTTELYVQFTDTNFGNPTPGQTSLSFQEVEDLVNAVVQVFLNLYNSTDSDSQGDCDPSFRDLTTVIAIVSVQINNEGETFTFNSNRFLMDEDSKTMHLDSEGRDDLDFDRSQPYFDAAIHANGHGHGHRKLQTSVDFSQYDPNNPTLSILVTGLGTCIFCSSYFGFGNDITETSFVTVRKQRHLFASGEDSFGRVGSADFHADAGMGIHARTVPSMATEDVTAAAGETNDRADSGIRSNIRSSKIPDFMHEYDGVANLRRLQADIDTEGVREDESQCYCGVGTNQIIIFNADDFRDQIDDEVDLPPDITLDDVQLVQTQDCEAETNDFVPEDLQLMLLVVPDVSASDLESFSTIFEMVYNELAAQYCDMLFRRVLVGSAITTINIPAGQTPNSDGCVLGDTTMETDGRCRGCGDGTPLVDEDPSATSPATGGAGRRSLQQLQTELDLDREFNVDLAGRPRHRRMQTEDTCFCAVDAIPDRGPFLLELYAALNSKLTEMGVESICGLTDEIIDILPPTDVPTSRPTSNPTVLASSAPTAVPTAQPTSVPTSAPTSAPTDVPTTQPTSNPTNIPTALPTPAPTVSPSALPTNVPTTQPTSVPTPETPNPTEQPTSAPTDLPTTQPTSNPTSAPTSAPTDAPTSQPTSAPTDAPTSQPTSAPTSRPTSRPTSAPTSNPTSSPTRRPTRMPVTSNPTSRPTDNPTSMPTSKPTDMPTRMPVTSNPTSRPTDNPTSMPTNMPSDNPTDMPTAVPTDANEHDECEGAQPLIRYDIESTFAFITVEGFDIMSEGPQPSADFVTTVDATPEDGLTFSDPMGNCNIASTNGVWLTFSIPEASVYSLTFAENDSITAGVKVTIFSGSCEGLACIGSFDLNPPPMEVGMRSLQVILEPDPEGPGPSQVELPLLDASLTYYMLLQNADDLVPVTEGLPFISNGCASFERSNSNFCVCAAELLLNGASVEGFPPQTGELEPAVCASDTSIPGFFYNLALTPADIGAGTDKWLFFFTTDEEGSVELTVSRGISSDCTTFTCQPAIVSACDAAFTVRSVDFTVAGDYKLIIQSVTDLPPFTATELYQPSEIASFCSSRNVVTCYCADELSSALVGGALTYGNGVSFALASDGSSNPDACFDYASCGVGLSSPAKWFQFTTPSVLAITDFRLGLTDNTGSVELSAVIFKTSSTVTANTVDKCDTLMCDMSGLADGSTVQLETDTSYFIVVQASGASTDLEATLTNIVPPANDMCGSAFTLVEGPGIDGVFSGITNMGYSINNPPASLDSVEVATTVLATGETITVTIPPICSISTEEGVWFAGPALSESQGVALKAFEADTGPGVPIVTVLSGSSCASFSCVGQLPASGEIPLFLRKDRMYYFYVQRGNPNALESTVLTMRDACASGNDNNYASCQCPDFPSADSAIDVLQTDMVPVVFTDCSGQPSLSGAWYRIPTEGISVVIFTNSITDAEVTASYAEDCDPSLCTSTNNLIDACTTGTRTIILLGNVPGEAKRDFLLQVSDPTQLSSAQLLFLTAGFTTDDLGLGCDDFPSTKGTCFCREVLVYCGEFSATLTSSNTGPIDTCFDYRGAITNKDHLGAWFELDVEDSGEYDLEISVTTFSRVSVHFYLAGTAAIKCDASLSRISHLTGVFNNGSVHLFAGAKYFMFVETDNVDIQVDLIKT